MNHDDLGNYSHTEVSLLREQISALTYDVLTATAERDQKDRELAALTEERDEKVLLNNQLADYLGNTEEQLATTQRELLKTRIINSAMVKQCEEAEANLAAAQATIEKYRKAIDALYNRNEATRYAVIQCFGVAHPQSDTTALQERLCQAKVDVLREAARMSLGMITAEGLAASIHRMANAIEKA